MSHPITLYFLQSHIFSLGMTLNFATGCQKLTSASASVSDLSPNALRLLTHMSKADPKERYELHQVMEICQGHLHGASSQDVCKRFAGCLPIMEHDISDWPCGHPRSSDFSLDRPSSQPVSASASGQKQRWQCHIGDGYTLSDRSSCPPNDGPVLLPHSCFGCMAHPQTDGTFEGHKMSNLLLSIPHVVVYCVSFIWKICLFLIIEDNYIKL